MRKLLVTVLTLLVVSNASAREYLNFDQKRLITAVETPSGKRASLDIPYLDQILNDLSAHAMNYPPQFDTPQDKQRATQDAWVLSKTLDMLIDVPPPNPELLARAGHVNSIGHNLDIPGAGEKADSIFRRLLTASPSHPRGNWMYGTFLAGAGKSKEALPYLEKALSLGVTDAAYAIGLTHLALGDKEGALKSLEDYKRSSPNDTNVDKIIDAVRNGKIEYKRDGSPSERPSPRSAAGMFANAQPQELPPIYLSVFQNPDGKTTVKFILSKPSQGGAQYDPIDAFSIAPDSLQKCNFVRTKDFSIPDEYSKSPLYDAIDPKRRLPLERLPLFFATVVSAELTRKGFTPKPEDSLLHHRCTQFLWEQLLGITRDKK
jgi:tetratricopeptide (TPR) repeat protein